MTTIRDELCRVEAYPAPRPTRVELRETHVSWVFLTDADVYKVKKPVDLGFLDFRTLAQRRAACEAEVQLNARLAAGVYLGVVPVRLDPAGRHHLGAQGPVVDWAVHMVRLPDERRADTLLRSGELDAEWIEAIAEHLAEFHGRARSGAHTTALGSLASISRNVEENFAQTADAITRYVSVAQAHEIVAWQRNQLREHAATFEERARAGHVRDGHGDLRLEHLYLGAPREVTIVDCIEFADRFRYADVCADVAFLSMDLAWHGRVDLAERFLSAYAREADDYDLYGVVDFYEGYRAFVRGKVSAILADDRGADEPTRRAAARDARRYFLLALAAERRPVLSPAVIAVGGVIASGKTTVAGAVAAARAAPVVDADRTRKRMLGVSPRAPLHTAPFTGAYDPAFTERVYAEVLRRAEVVLASGRPVVIDASFRTRAMRRAARDLATRHGVAFRFLECRAPREVCRARLVARAAEAAGQRVSDGRLEIFDDFCDRVETVDELPATEHIALDTTAPLDSCLAAVDVRVGAWPAGLTG